MFKTVKNYAFLIKFAILNLFIMSVFIWCMIEVKTMAQEGKTWHLFAPETYTMFHVIALISGILISIEFIAICLKEGINILKTAHEVKGIIINDKNSQINLQDKDNLNQN